MVDVVQIWVQGMRNTLDPNLYAIDHFSPIQPATKNGANLHDLGTENKINY